MAANDYSTLTARLVTALSTLAGTYTGLVVERREFDPANLPSFDRYCIVVAPTSRPWGDRLTAVREKQTTLRADLYLLVKVFDESAALFGTSAPDLGLFQLIDDVKTLLQASDLDGLVFRSYDEAMGEVEFGRSAATGFDASEYRFVVRAKLPYAARMTPVCLPR